MKKTDYLMLTAVVLLAALCITLLPGCSAPAPEVAEVSTAEAVTAPEETPPPTVFVTDEELSLLKCKTALEDIQSMESYDIISENLFYGDMVVNDSSTSYYLKDGEDWVECFHIPESGYAGDEPIWFTGVARMCKDGVYYNTEMDGGGMASDGSCHWGKTSLPPERVPQYYYSGPWIYTFDWDAQEVRHVSTLSVGGGESIRVQVMAPFPEGSIPTEDSYTVEFYFGPSGRFEKAVIQYYSADSAGRTSFCYTEQIRSTDPEVIASDMEFYTRTIPDD